MMKKGSKRYNSKQGCFYVMSRDLNYSGGLFPLQLLKKTIVCSRRLTKLQPAETFTVNKLTEGVLYHNFKISDIRINGGFSYLVEYSPTISPHAGRGHGVNARARNQRHASFRA